jgi:hypothetical protein
VTLLTSIIRHAAIFPFIFNIILNTISTSAACKHRRIEASFLFLHQATPPSKNPHNPQATFIDPLHFALRTIFMYLLYSMDRTIYFIPRKMQAALSKTNSHTTCNGCNPQLARLSRVAMLWNGAATGVPGGPYYPVGEVAMLIRCMG